MKVQKHINVPAGGYWYRCSRVEFIDEKAEWDLNPTSRYSFYAVYEKRPHRLLVEAGDDASLRSFVKAWGPLRFSLDTWSGSDPIETYRSERDRLRATIQVLTSVEDTELQRFAITHWLECVHSTSNEDVILFPLRQTLALPGDLRSGFDQSFRDWLETATPMQIESAIIGIMPLLSGSPLTSPRFVVDQQGRRNVLRAELGLSSLSDALYWMVWQDIFQKHPFQFCAECRRLFQPDTRHGKKFCSPECAHRKTARDWQQRKRKKERERNGSQKAR